MSTHSSESELRRLARSVSTAQSLEDLARPLLALIQRLTGLESTYLTRIDEQAGFQEIVYSLNTVAIELPEQLQVPWEDTLCRRALLEQRYVTDDVAEVWGDSQAARDLGLKTYVSVPVRDGKGELYGTLCGASGDKRDVDETARDVMLLFAELLSRQIAREDATWGALQRAEKAERLQSCCRQGDLAARYGGDEFVLVFSSEAAGDEADVSAQLTETVLAERINQATTGRYELTGLSLDYQGASVGIATWSPTDGDEDALLKRADHAMYADKQRRRQTKANR